MEKKFLPEIQISVDKLPSKGKSYPKEATLSYKTYSFGDVKNASISNINIAKSIDLAVDGIIASFDKDTLTLMDTLYLGLLRKVSSFNGVEFTIPFQCEKCNEVSEGHFNHSDIVMDDLPDEVVELPIVFDLDGENELHFSPMTIKTYKEIENGKYTKYCKGKKIDKLTTLALCCVNKPFEEVLHLLNNTYDPDIIEDLEHIDEVMLHGVKPLELICKKEVNGQQCNHTNSVKLEGLEHLLKPFRKGKPTDRRRIRFGNTPTPESI